MEFLNDKRIKVSSALNASLFEMPRREKLNKHFKRIVSDNFGLRASGKPFEAKGLIVTGESRSGKTTEIEDLVNQFNDQKYILFDDVPARIISCKLSGVVSWKDMGLNVLKELGFPFKNFKTVPEIWMKVAEQVKLQGVIGIHFDECQHVFGKGSKVTNSIILDSFKSLAKQSGWPLILILSGVPDLLKFVVPYEQLNYLMTHVRFDLIDLDRKPSKEKGDLECMNEICFHYADMIDIDFEPLSNRGFMERLCFAGANRWGLVIELVIEALTLCKLDDQSEISLKYFEEAFADKTGIPLGFSPFSDDDYQEAFSKENLVAMLTGQVD